VIRGDEPPRPIKPRCAVDARGTARGKNWELTSLHSMCQSQPLVVW
jgi:hypothetical protein